MIRREIQLPGQRPQWLLISQVEHARLCGALAEHCLPAFDAGFRRELMRAVIHHDDGWSEWDLAPHIDPEQGRPYSFRELSLADSLKIWENSVFAAAAYGPMAGWVVAGHFLDLQSKGDSARDPIAVEWRAKFIARRDTWFQSWAAENSEQHTRDSANLGLAWLQLLDMMSLWLCSVCPGVGEAASQDRDSYLFAEGQVLETWCHFREQRASFEPWEFELRSFEVIARGWIVPIQRYTESDELLAVAKPYEIRWELQALA